MTIVFSTSTICKLADFCQEFEKPGFVAGKTAVPDPSSSGVAQMPFVTYKPAVEAFIEAAYENDWVRSDFSWLEWQGSDEAQELRRDHRSITDASFDQLTKLLTVFVRQERFCEGALLEAFDCGLVLRIVRRARDVCRAQRAS